MASLAYPGARMYQVFPYALPGVCLDAPSVPISKLERWSRRAPCHGAQGGIWPVESRGQSAPVFRTDGTGRPSSGVSITSCSRLTRPGPSGRLAWNQHGIVAMSHGSSCPTPAFGVHR
jgi:hypothetical protein